MNYQEMKNYAEEMLSHYLFCCAWSTSGVDSEGVEHESLEDFEFSDNAQEIALLDCLYFVRISHPWLNVKSQPISPENAGHDLWLTREGHGTGFWDRGYVYGDQLTKLSKSMGVGDAYLSDNNEIEF